MALESFLFEHKPHVALHTRIVLARLKVNCTPSLLARRFEYIAILSNFFLLFALTNYGAKHVTASHFLDAVCPERRGSVLEVGGIFTVI